MWVHSYEFERTLGWELLEDICKKLSGNGDIWFATNMEIWFDVALQKQKSTILKFFSG